MYFLGFVLRYVYVEGTIEFWTIETSGNGQVKNCCMTVFCLHMKKICGLGEYFTIQMYKVNICEKEKGDINRLYLFTSVDRSRVIYLKI